MLHNIIWRFYIYGVIKIVLQKCLIQTSPVFVNNVSDPKGKQMHLKQSLPMFSYLLPWDYSGCGFKLLTVTDISGLD